MDARYDEAVLGAQQGSEWAWTALYHWLSPRLLGYIRARGAVEPQDALGEVWLQLARNMPSFQGDASAFRTWAFTVAHHRVIDEARSRSRRPPGLPLDEHIDRAERNLGFVDAERQVLDRLELEELVVVLGPLPATQQAILLLRILGDLSVQQTAQVLNISESAVKSMQYRAVAALRVLLGPNATKPPASTVTGAR